MLVSASLTNVREEHSHNLSLVCGIDQQLAHGKFLYEAPSVGVQRLCYETRKKYQKAAHGWFSRRPVSLR